MKKKLLTIAFLGAMTFASAQSGVTVDLSNTSSAQNFLFGNTATDDIQDISIVTVDAGVGANATLKGSFIGFLSGAGSSDGEATFAFTATGNSGNEFATITINAEKRGGNIATVNLSASSGGTSLSGEIVPSTGNTTSISDHALTITNVPLSTSATTITLELTELLVGDVSNASNRPTFRIESMDITVQEQLSVDNISNTVNGINISPNPVASSFQLNSDDVESVQIFDITGSLLKTFGANANYDISDLAAGVYMANVTTKAGSKTLKVIKN